MSAQASRSPRQPGSGRAVLAATLARVGTLPVSLICSLLSIRLMLEGIGVADYGLVSLLLALQVLLPFLDLGTGAGVLDGAAHQRATGSPEQLRARWRTAVRVTLATSLVVLLVSLAIQVLGAWDEILGVPGDTRVGVAVVVIAAVNLLGRPAQVSFLALQGLGHPIQVVVLQVLVPVTSLGIIALGAFVDGPLWMFGASLAFGQLLAGAAGLLSLRRRGDLTLAEVIGLGRLDVARPLLDTVSMAAPMLVITVVMPLGAGLDRIILSHRSTVFELATYAVVAQLLQPISSLTSTAHQSLWGDIARHRHTESLTWGYLRRVGGLVTIAAAVGAVGFGVLLPLVTDVVTGGELEASWGLAFFAAAVVLVQVLQVVPGALLTTPQGLRQQAVAIVLGTALNLTLTWVLAASWGAAGAVVGTAAGFLLQYVITTTLAVPTLRSIRRLEEGTPRP